MLNIPLWKRWFIILFTTAGVLLAIPSFLDQKLYEKLPNFLQQQVSLGLDLQGGSHLLLEIDVQQALKEQLEFQQDELKRQLRRDGIAYASTKIENGAIVIRFLDIQQMNSARKLLTRPELDLEESPELTALEIKFSDTAVAQKRLTILRQTREIIDRRVNSLGTKEPNIQTQGANRIIVQLPGVEDPAQVKALIGKTAKLTFQLLHPEYPTLASSGGRVLPGTQALPEDAASIPPSATDPSQSARKPLTYLVRKKVYLTGEHLVNASVGEDRETQQKTVNFQLDAIGARKFGDVTRRNVGKRLALILDGKVISAPSVNQPILGGAVQITGNFTTREASVLAISLRSGALPAPISVIEERTVGPDLGADSIRAGELATVVAIALIFVFMILVYALFGIFASIALACNLALLVTALALTGSTLTLPGLAGIALTLGMAVDANVLIFERIREEMRDGRKPRKAIDSGYRRAMATILDSNLTTLIGALALYFFGSGPIKGFGVTLTIGICISMFTAITLTRVITVLWLGRKNPETLPI